jgi:hypothetical protein
MKLEDYRQTFYTYSGKLSDITRQLAFAGIAVIWLFKKDVSGTPAIPQKLLLPGLLILISLFLDMAQYFAASWIWRCVYRSKEKAGVSEEAELERHPEWLELPIFWLFVLKIVALSASYVLIGFFLWQQLRFT